MAGLAALYVLDDGPRGPAENMARDEALLASDGAWLRFYRWEPFTLSLGYFQPLASFATLAPGLPRVRRPTGGGAILHAEEITLALVVPEASLPADVRASYGVLNAAVAAAAAAEGVTLRPPAAEPPAGRADWCFALATGLDLVDEEGRKVFGSAQRRRGDRVLQHGSLILRRHPSTPFTGELGPVDRVRLQQRLAVEIAARLAMPLVNRAAYPAEARELARRLETTRYGDPAWTGRR